MSGQKLLLQLASIRGERFKTNRSNDVSHFVIRNRLMLNLPELFVAKTPFTAVMDGLACFEFAITDMSLLFFYIDIKIKESHN